MTARRSPRVKGPGRPPARRDDDGPGKDPNPGPDKRNMTVQPDPDLRERVDAVARRTRNSWGATALNLIELGLVAQAGPAEAGTLRLVDLPAWLAAAVHEIGKLTGQDPQAVMLDVLLKNVRTELETARAQEKHMAGLLKRPQGPPPGQGQ